MSIREFNSYNWRQFELQKRENVPNGPHFVALVLGTRTECSPAYDKNDTDSYYSVPEVKHYVFTKREDLTLFVDEISRTDTKFVFYSVKELGKARVEVKVSIED